MRAVHESAYKPKLRNETKFIVNIRPVNQSEAALSAANNGGSGFSGSSGTPVAVNRADAGRHSGVDVGMGVASSRNSRAEVNWRRVFTVSSFILSLLLISGSIYLHLRQKPHLGRLNHAQHISTAGGVAASTPDSVDTQNIAFASAPVASANGSSVGKEENSFTTSSIITTMTPATNSMTSKDVMQLVWGKTLYATDSTSSSSSSGSRTQHLTEACMQCICETTTQCRPATCGNNVNCGVFRISRLYWLDAGKPESDDNNTNNITATYEHCVNNIYCATRTVAAYINKYARDCNHDGKIECLDHIALHLLGPSGCIQSEGELLPIYTQRMEDCLTMAEYM